MKRENLTLLLIGMAFGLLVGFLAYRALLEPTGEAAAASGAPAPAPTAAGVPPGGGSAEFNRVMQELEALRARLEQHPDDPATLVRLGDLLFQTRIWDEALRFYDRALSIDRSAELLTVTGLCLRQLGRYEEAIQRFDGAREADPTHWPALYNTALVHGLDLGDYERAEAVLQQLDAERPGDPDVATLRAEIERRRNSGSG